MKIIDNFTIKLGEEHKFLFLNEEKLSSIFIYSPPS